MPRAKKTSGEGSSASKNYSIIEGKTLDPNQFSREVINMLEFQGLLNRFLLVDCAIYPSLVKEFYKNMKVKEVRGAIAIKSFVKTVKIELNPSKIAKMLQLTLSGLTNYHREDWIETNELGFRDYLRYMLGRDDDDIYVNDRPSKNELSGEQRILTLFISECILPNRNKSNAVGSLECAFAYFLKHKVKFNLPVILLKHMAFCKQSNRKNLPYGMILSWIFLNEKVDLTGEVRKHSVRIMLNARSLRAFNLYQVEGNEYITLHELNQKPVEERRDLLDKFNISHKRARAGVEIVAQEEGEEGEGEEEEASSEGEPYSEIRTKTLYDTQVSIPTMLDNFQKEVRKEFSKLNKKVHKGLFKLHQRLTCIENKLGVEILKELHPSNDDGNGNGAQEDVDVDVDVEVDIGFEEFRREQGGTSSGIDKGKIPIVD